jgi:hypothetical protein
VSGDSIFLLSDDGDDPFVELRAEPYSSEDLLQRLLAEHPDLLAGGQMNVQVPRRWLLVSRELGVPKQEGGAGWWSLDHLFVDQEGVPTFVEVKRSSNTEIRRQVVGQMLDYAANGTRYWPITTIRSTFEAQCENAGTDPAAVLGSHLGEGADAEAFWVTVAEHLQAGKVRIVFVSDIIPPELQRIIEFLNEHMAAIDVLGVEVRQYVGPGRRTLVPRVIGLTGAAQQAKVAGQRPKYRDLLADAPDAVRDIESLLLAWADSHGLKTHLSAAARQFRTADGRGVLQLYPGYGVIEIPLEPMRQSGNSADADDILDRLTGIASKKLARKYPNIPCKDVVEAWDGARVVLDDWLHLVRSAEVSGTPFAYGG